MKRLFVTLCCAMLLAVTAWAADVNLAWDHSISDGVVGYKMYVGNAPRTYNRIDLVPYQTTWTVSNLSPGTYYFAVTAFDIGKNESDYSNEVSTVVLSLAPSITVISVPSILANEATIVWTTSSECSGIALWGLSSSQMYAVSSNNLGTTDHLSRITGLTRRTHYVYKVQSVCGGQTIESNLRSFNTK